MVRALVVLARGRCGSMPSRGASTRLGMPRWARARARNRPLGPPPAMTTVACAGSECSGGLEEVEAMKKSCPLSFQYQWDQATRAAPGTVAAGVEAAVR